MPIGDWKRAARLCSAPVHSEPEAEFNAPNHWADLWLFAMELGARSSELNPVRTSYQLPAPSSQLLAH